MDREIGYDDGSVRPDVPPPNGVIAPPRRRRRRPVRGESARRRNSTRELLELFIPAFLGAALLSLGAAFLPSPVWAYGAFFGFTGFAVGLIKKSPATFVLLSPLIADRVTEFISGAAIEAGAYMTETKSYGVATGAFAHLLIIYIAFYGVCAIVTEAMWPNLRTYLLNAQKNWEGGARKLCIGLYIVLAIFSVYMLRLGINNGFPILTGVDRFDYLNTLDSPFYTFVLHNRIIAIPFIGALLTVPKYRFQAIAMIILIVLFSVLFSEKFGSLLLILTVAFIPTGLLHVARGRRINLAVVGGVAAAVAVVTVPAVLLVYGAAKDPHHAIQAYGNRVALQGQLWWHGDNKYLNAFAFDDNAIRADIGSWIDPTADSRDNTTAEYGLYYVMQRFAPSRIVGLTMEGGTGFVFSLYPYLLMTTGIFGLLIVSSILAAFHAVIMSFLAEAMARGNWIALLAFARLFSNMMTCYTSGYLYSAFGFKTIGLFIIGVILLKVYGPSALSELFSARKRPVAGRKAIRRSIR